MLLDVQILIFGASRLQHDVRRNDAAKLQFQ